MACGMANTPEAEGEGEEGGRRGDVGDGIVRAGEVVWAGDLESCKVGAPTKDAALTEYELGADL